MNELTLPTDATVLVASDMHLGDHDPGTARFFLDALDVALTGAHRASHLLLLGDLFEAWPGDDQTDPIAQLLVDRLLALSSSGVHVLVMRGNRDFLLDVRFAGNQQAAFSEQTSATMLDDPTLLRIGQNQVLLMHGDTLCTDDQAYQEFRAQNRTQQWQQAFLSESLTHRMQVARQLREQSKAHQRHVAQEISDVNSTAVDQALSGANVATLLHGHTHRPDRHRWSSEGQARARYVLPDWDQTQRRGGFMRIDKSAITVMSLP